MVDTVRLCLYFFLIAKLMTGCFFRLPGKGGFTNCACCSRMIILLHLLNVSLNLFSINTGFNNISLQCCSAGGVCRSLSALMISLTSPGPHLECLALIDITFSVVIIVINCISVV